MNSVQEAMFIGSQEESGIWDVLNDISISSGVDRDCAFDLLKGEFDFLVSRSDIFLVKSDGLYESETCQVIEKMELMRLSFDDVDFKEHGPFYYLSSNLGI